MTLDAAGLELLFLNARSHSFWQDKSVARETLQQLHDIVKFGPTSANCAPARYVYLTTRAAKERLRPHLIDGNVDKTMSAPVVVIIGYDRAFYEHLPKLFPHNLEARSWFDGNDALIEATAFRNSTLQGAYLIIAARALGLDCGPMSGFDNAGVDRAFFAGSDVKSNFICNLGYGRHEELFPRNPRFDFDDVCQIL